MLFEFFREFIDEFSNLDLIAYLHGLQSLSHESRIFREHVHINFPGTPYFEQAINTSLASFLGPQSVGVVVVEKTDIG